MGDPLRPDAIPLPASPRTIVIDRLFGMTIRALWGTPMICAAA